METQTPLRIGRDRFLTLLRHQELLVEQRRYKPQTTNSRHWMRKYSNLIEGLKPTRPNELWVADITYLELRPVYRYLSLITDAYSHKVVGWAVGSRYDNTIARIAARTCTTETERRWIDAATDSSFRSWRSILFGCLYEALTGARHSNQHDN